VLPELPLDAWFPQSRLAREEDAEEPGGPRQRALAEAARDTGVAVLGGVVVRDPSSGRRTSRALLFARDGALLASYAKLHLPAEPGFWESDHYEPGREPPRAICGLALRLGIQICSDLNRPEGSHLLGAQGVEAILAPRATPAASYERWLVVLRANAITSCAHVRSTNRPAEAGTMIGGPSVAIAPDGEVLHETVQPLSVVRLHRAAIARARRDYPGYLTVRAGLYGQAWASLEADPP
jgi:predicted amidohydrolase